MEMPPDTLEAVGVNELFVAVTVDASFTTEQAVVGLIDEKMNRRCLLHPHFRAHV